MIEATGMIIGIPIGRFGWPLWQGIIEVFCAGLLTAG
jgi:hypothetical protein